MRRVLFCVIVLAVLVSVLGCAATAVNPTPAAPSSNAAPAPVGAGAPAARKTPLPLPPQPTSPPQPTGQPYAWQTAVPALVVSGPAIAPASSTKAAAVPTATTAPATAQPTATKSPAATTAAPPASGAATGKRSEAKFSFDPALSTIEEAETLEAELKKVPGIMEISASQTSAVVAYDAGLITVEQITARFALLGHPVKRQ